MCLVWGAEQWANGYRVIANRKIQPRQEDAGAQAAQRCSPHKVVSFLLFNSCNFCSRLPLKAVESLSFCVKKKNPHMVSSAIHFHPCVREGVQTARCKADLLQRALCNGWRLSIDMRLHLRFFLWHHRSYFVVVWGLWPHWGWSIFWPPPAPYPLGMALIPPFSDWSTMQACRTDPLAQSHRFLSFLKYTLDASGQLDTLAKKKRKKKITSSCLHNPKHLRRNSLCCYCTFHRKQDFPPSLPRFFSTGLAGYLLPLPQRLNRGERAFCGIEAICIANDGPRARMTTPYRDFEGPLQLSNTG